MHTFQDPRSRRRGGTASIARAGARHRHHQRSAEIYAVLTQTRTLGRPWVDAELVTLATALYVTTDDLLKAQPEQIPWRPVVGIQPRVTDAEIITLAVMQALLSFTSVRGHGSCVTRTSTCGRCSSGPPRSEP